MKKKLLLPILSVCMVVALVSVGFAAWLITGVDAGKAEGQFTAYEVTNNFFSITVENTTDKVVFGKPSNYSANASDWFIPETGVDSESLTATFTITITPASGTLADSDALAALFTANSKTKVTITIKEQDASSESKFDTAKTANCVVLPKLKIGDASANVDATSGTGETLKEGVTFELTQSNFTVTDNKATATVTLVFGWGTFGGSTAQNPYLYYNSLTNNKDNAEAAQQAMDKVKALNDVKYDFVLGVA